MWRGNFAASVTVLLLIVAASRPVRAEAQTGTIKGRILDASTGAPLPGATVTVTGPQGESTDFSDANGLFQITALPPGEYLVRAYYSDLVSERSGVFLGADQTLALTLSLAAEKAKVTTFTTTVAAPTVDVGNTQIQTTITEELMSQVPIRGQTFESIVQFAPGVAPEAVGYSNHAGFSINGATSVENVYMIDGFNTTNPNYGFVGTPLSLRFLEEANVITGGYNAEYGRMQGGVISLVTKSGSNEWKSGVWLDWQPFELSAHRVARLGEAVSTEYRPNSSLFDVGGEVGGPIIKDHLFFYAGFQPVIVGDSYTRVLRTRLATNLPASQMSGTYPGDLAPGDSCPSYIRSRSPSLCTGAGYTTADISGSSHDFSSTSRLFSIIGKLDYKPVEDHRISLTYIGSPSTFDGVYNNPRDVPGGAGTNNGFNADPNALPFKETIQVHDLVGRLNSKFIDRTLEVDVGGGWHHELYRYYPSASSDGAVVNNQISNLSRYESNPACTPTMVHGVAFNPCPVSNYQYGGLGPYHNAIMDRYSGIGSLTYYLHLAGIHAFKVGGDLEQIRYDSNTAYTGGDTGGYFTIQPDGSINRQQYATLNPTTNNIQVLGNGFRALTHTMNTALYARDSYSLSFLPGATVNLGLRWETQRIRDINDTTQLSIKDNLSPRVGLIYDWTQQGRSKVYASYARYYESIPMDLPDRAFTGTGFLVQNAPASACQMDALGRVIPSTCNFGAPQPAQLSGGTFNVVSPQVRAMYTDEFTGGLQYDVGWDTVLGAVGTHRQLGRIIEDFSPDGGADFILGNPGAPVDQGVVAGVQRDIQSLQQQLAASTNPAQQMQLQAQLAKKIKALALYEGQSSFPKPKRDYNALTLTAHKRFGHNFTLLASYTYSRTTGNYTGLYSNPNQQLNPNSSTQFDLYDLLINSQGPLPNDRPHAIKLIGAYFVPLGPNQKDGLTLGLSFSAMSGVPIDVLGFHPFYGSGAVFVLPRGAGGRTPTVTQLDLRVAYSYRIAGDYKLDAVLDIFNVFDSQTALAVDSNYTFDTVQPIPNGTYKDLSALKNNSGGKPALNSNYGQPTALQAPLAGRAGLKLSF